MDATSYWQLIAALDGFNASQAPAVGAHGVTAEMMDAWFNE